jgi:hypothetical protein|tara:strand:+ start:1124 stop:1801 length:678 start_codon:yes stop_codon:yes gene_type:complete
MRYAHHDLFQNLNRIKNSKDMTISRELIVSEIAKIIVGRPFEVIKLLRGCRVSVSENASKRELVYAVNFNLAQSKCLRDGIASLISSNQLPFRETEQYYNVTSTTTPAKTGMTGSDWVGGISTLVGIGYGIFSTNASRKDAKSQRSHELELANMNSDLMLKQMELQNQPPPTVAAVGGGGTGTMTWIILGVGAVAIGVFAYIASKKNRAVAIAPAQLPTGISRVE